MIKLQQQERERVARDTLEQAAVVRELPLPNLPGELRLPGSLHLVQQDTWQCAIRPTGHQVFFGRVRDIQLALRN